MACSWLGWGGNPSACRVKAPSSGAGAEAAPQLAQFAAQCAQFGQHLRPLDVGGLGQALHLEHMTLLWVRMVRVGRHPAGLVWAALRR